LLELYMSMKEIRLRAIHKENFISTEFSEIQIFYPVSF
jgi:hypothetical protein